MTSDVASFNVRHLGERELQEALTAAEDNSMSTDAGRSNHPEPVSFSIPESEGQQLALVGELCKEVLGCMARLQADRDELHRTIEELRSVLVEIPAQSESMSRLRAVPASRPALSSRADAVAPTGAQSPPAAVSPGPATPPPPPPPPTPPDATATAGRTVYTPPGAARQPTPPPPAPMPPEPAVVPGARSAALDAEKDTGSPAGAPVDDLLAAEFGESSAPDPGPRADERPATPPPPSPQPPPPPVTAAPVTQHAAPPPPPPPPAPAPGHRSAEGVTATATPAELDDLLSAEFGSPPSQPEPDVPPVVPAASVMLPSNPRSPGAPPGGNSGPVRPPAPSPGPRPTGGDAPGQSNAPGQFTPPPVPPPPAPKPPPPPVGPPSPSTRARVAQGVATAAGVSVDELLRAELGSDQNANGPSVPQAPASLATHRAPLEDASRTSSDGLDVASLRQLLASRSDGVNAPAPAASSSQQGSQPDLSSGEYLQSARHETELLASPDAPLPWEEEQPESNEEFFGTQEVSDDFFARAHVMRRSRKRR